MSRENSKGSFDDFDQRLTALLQESEELGALELWRNVRSEVRSGGPDSVDTFLESQGEHIVSQVRRAIEDLKERVNEI